MWGRGSRPHGPALVRYVLGWFKTSLLLRNFFLQRSHATTSIAASKEGGGTERGGGGGVGVGVGVGVGGGGAGGGAGAGGGGEGGGGGRKEGEGGGAREG